MIRRSLFRWLVLRAGLALSTLLALSGEVQAAAVAVGTSGAVFRSTTAGASWTGPVTIDANVETGVVNAGDLRITASLPAALRDSFLSGQWNPTAMLLSPEASRSSAARRSPAGILPVRSSMPMPAVTQIGASVR